MGVLRIAIGSIFVASSAGKLIDNSGAVFLLANILSVESATPVIVVFSLFEGVSGVLIIFNKLSPLLIHGIGLLVITITIIGSASPLFSLGADCGCFGALLDALSDPFLL
jgi:hypothetical protein